MINADAYPKSLKSLTHSSGFLSGFPALSLNAQGSFGAGPRKFTMRGPAPFSLTAIATFPGSKATCARNLSKA